MNMQLYCPHWPTPELLIGVPKKLFVCNNWLSCFVNYSDLLWRKLFRIHSNAIIYIPCMAIPLASHNWPRLSNPSSLYIANQNHASSLGWFYFYFWVKCQCFIRMCNTMRTNDILQILRRAKRAFHRNSWCSLGSIVYKLLEEQF